MTWWGESIPIMTAATAIRQCLGAGLPTYLIRQVFERPTATGIVSAAHSQTLTQLLEARYVGRRRGWTNEVVGVLNDWIDEVGVGSQGLLLGQGDRMSTAMGTWLGALIESLAVQLVRVCAEAMNAHVGHLRTKSGDREIDIVVETNGIACVKFEVKLADTVQNNDVKHLQVRANYWLPELRMVKMGQRIGLGTRREN